MIDFNKPCIVTVLVTPELARKWLGWNVNNRDVIQSEVDEITELMKQGNWKEPDETIDFLHNGILVNGQHRLNAVIQSGVSIEMKVHTCVDKEVIPRGKNGFRVYKREV